MQKTGLGDVITSDLRLSGGVLALSTRANGLARSRDVARR
jgi:hypothetical protein